MKQQDFSKWEEIRAKGRKQYAIRYGVFGWGLITAIIFYALMLASGNIHDYLLDGVFILVIFLMGGYGWGRTMWAWTERRYQKAQKR